MAYLKKEKNNKSTIEYNFLLISSVDFMKLPIY